MQGQGLLVVIDALGVELDTLKREVLRLRDELSRARMSHDADGEGDQNAGSGRESCRPG